MTETTTPLAPKQGTSLTVVSDTLTELQKVEAGLADLATRFAGVVYDVQTTKGMEQAKADRLEVREVRYSVQRAAKTAKDWLNDQKKVIDQKAEYVTGEIQKIETPIDEQIKAEEQRRADEKAAREKAERERIEAIAKKLAEIRAKAVVLPGTKSVEIERIVALLVVNTPTEAEFGDMHEAAMRAFDETLLKLKAHNAAAIEFERQQAELERQREEQRAAAEAAKAAAKAEAERLAAERLALEVQQAAARAEAQRLDEQRKADQKAIEDQLAARRQAVEAERREREAALRAEQEAFEAQRRAFDQQMAEQRAELERMKAATMPARTPEPAPAPAVDVDTFAPDNGVCGSRPLADKPVVEIALEAAPEAPVPEEKATLKLGEIQRLLGLPIPSLLLADLGHPAADIPGTNAKLYKPSEFGRICRSLIAHIAKVADEFDASRN